MTMISVVTVIGKSKFEPLEGILKLAFGLLLIVEENGGRGTNGEAQAKEG
jgi:hypothetical protein